MVHKYKIIQTLSSSNFIYKVHFWEGLMSSENFHWIRQDLNTCPRVDMCPQSNGSNGTYHGTQAAPVQCYVHCAVLSYLHCHCVVFYILGYNVIF